MGSPEESVPHQDDAPREAQSSAIAPQQVTPASQPPDPFWARIKRHKVVEWTLAYVAFGYALLHGVQMLRETFDWSYLVPRLTVFALVLGAPIAVTLAWYHGHRARHRVSGQELSILIALLVVAGSALWWVSRNSHERATVPAAASNTAAPPAAAFNPPPHSIAVLPFVNMSGDKDQEYFSEGLTEELLNSLTRINELQVAARTSSFLFQREHPDIATVAHKLNVGAVLEGSVRKSGQTLRVTTQLVNGTTGFHVWSQTYDRDLGDVLQLQTEIATSVAEALKVTLLGDVAAKIELGATRNPAAFDAYLRALIAFQSRREDEEIPAAIEAYNEAIRLDPGFALAFAGRSYAVNLYYGMVATGRLREGVEKARADAQRAIALAPDLAEGHVALANVLATGSLDFARANEAYARALALAPGNAQVLRETGAFAVLMGRSETGIAALRRAVVLDPLAGYSHYRLGHGLYFSRRYEDSTTVLAEAIKLNPGYERAYGFRGEAFYGLGDLRSARASCESKRDDIESQCCLAVVYGKLGRQADADRELAKLKATSGDALAYQYAEIYAQWGDRSRALEWLDTAMRLRDGGLETMKMDPLMDPLRKEPRFQAIERELKFPD